MDVMDIHLISSLVPSLVSYSWSLSGSLPGSLFTPTSGLSLAPSMSTNTYLVDNLTTHISKSVCVLHLPLYCPTPL